MLLLTSLSVPLAMTALVTRAVLALPSLDTVLVPPRVETPMALLFSRVPLTLLQATITKASTATGIWDDMERDFICGFLKTHEVGATDTMW